MFKNPYHQKILTVIHSLNTELFKECDAYFGGGTLITLSFGEYRWSKDIDFICPIGPGYKRLRDYCFDHRFNPAALFSVTEKLTFPRDVKADQYGIRFPVIVEEQLIKFEIVVEARLTLSPPVFQTWSKVPCLDFVDMCAEKLLANADRWFDTAIESRDLIDLAVLRNQQSIPKKAVEKAEAAYAVIPSLQKAIARFVDQDDYQNKCFTALQISDRQPIMEGIFLLKKDFA